MKYEKRVAGVDIIDLGMGNPTDPTPECVVDKLAEAATRPAQSSLQRQQRHRRPAQGSRQEIQAASTASSSTRKPRSSPPSARKEGFSHLCLALLGPGRHGHRRRPGVSDPHLRRRDGRGERHPRAAGQRPGVPRSHRAARSTGCIPTPKLLILNYPHNPTAMTIEPGFWDKRDRDVPPARRDDHQRLRLRRDQLRRLQGAVASSPRRGRRRSASSSRR